VLAVGRDVYVPRIWPEAVKLDGKEALSFAHSYLRHRVLDVARAVPTTVSPSNAVGPGSTYACPRLGWVGHVPREYPR
jgi:hypothetical protein